MTRINCWRNGSESTLSSLKATPSAPPTPLPFWECQVYFEPPFRNQGHMFLLFVCIQGCIGNLLLSTTYWSSIEIGCHWFSVTITMEMIVFWYNHLTDALESGKMVRHSCCRIWFGLLGFCIVLCFLFCIFFIIFLSCKFYWLHLHVKGQFSVSLSWWMGGSWFHAVLR